MEWLSKYGETLTIIVSAITLYFFLKNSMRKELDEVKFKLGKIEDNLTSINLRLTRLEGRFDERGYWESRKTGTEEKNK